MLYLDSEIRLTSKMNNIMKKGLIILFLIVLFGTQKVVSQTPDYAQTFEKIEALGTEAVEAYEAKDYTGALSYTEEILAIYYAMPEQFMAEYCYILSGLYYDVACYNSLMGNLPEAIGAFEKAVVEHGFSEYNYAVNDSDLDNIRQMPRFAELMQLLRERGDYQWLLSRSGDYVSSNGKELPTFTYQSVDDPDLVKVKEYFNLEKIAGDGDEISRILNVLSWAHNVVRHDGSSYNPESKNAIDLVEICRREERGINCRMMAQMLNECYLALGFKSRYVTCMPKVMISDCHVINVVYSETLGKWIWVDPTFNAYVTDENGVMLGIGEVRERLRTGAPLQLNEDANWNNIDPITKEYYLDYYMAKNLYYLVSPLHSTSDAETIGKRERPTFVSLIPSDYTLEESNRSPIETSDDKYFWQRPTIAE